MTKSSQPDTVLARSAEIGQPADVRSGRPAAASRRPALAYVVNSLQPGGTEKLVVEMCRAFSAQFDVTAICLDEPGAWAEQLRSQGIAVHCLWRQPGIDLSMPWKLAKLLRRLDARIVHAHQCTAWFHAALARVLYSAPRLLFEEHGRFYPEVDSLPRRLVNRLVIKPLTHRCVAVSADVAKRLERYEGLRAKDLEIIYNGVSAESSLTPEERAALRKSLGFESESFVVGTVGRFDPIKNLPLLVNALSRVSQLESRVRGLLIGEGIVFQDIRSLVDGLGVADRIRLTGYRGDARTIVQCMDLFVLPSFSEGTSMALLEAMAAGVPVAVTDVGGNPEVVLRDRTGWVFPSDSIDALQSIILDAMGQPSRLHELGEAGRRRFQEQFAFDSMLARYAERYRELLNKAA